MLKNRFFIVFLVSTAIVVAHCDDNPRHRDSNLMTDKLLLQKKEEGEDATSSLLSSKNSPSSSHYHDGDNDNNIKTKSAARENNRGLFAFGGGLNFDGLSDITEQSIVTKGGFTKDPTYSPTESPTTFQPTLSPSSSPSIAPSSRPSSSPSSQPSFFPSTSPSDTPSMNPTSNPTTTSPTTLVPTVEKLVPNLAGDNNNKKSKPAAVDGQGDNNNTWVFIGAGVVAVVSIVAALALYSKHDSFHFHRRRRRRGLDVVTSGSDTGKSLEHQQNQNQNQQQQQLTTTKHKLPPTSPNSMENGGILSSSSLNPDRLVLFHSRSGRSLADDVSDYSESAKNAIELVSPNTKTGETQIQFFSTTTTTANNNKEGGAGAGEIAVSRTSSRSSSTYKTTTLGIMGDGVNFADVTHSGMDGDPLANPGQAADFNFTAERTFSPCGSMETITNAFATTAGGLFSIDDVPDVNAPTRPVTGLYDCTAPPGPLGIVVDTSINGPIIHTIKSSSPLVGLIKPGDIVVGLDEMDTRSMTAATLTRLMAKRSSQEKRKLTLLAGV